MPSGWRQPIPGLLAICISMLLLAGGAVAGTTSKYCSKEADNVVVYIDRTTPYDAIDKKDLVDGVSRLFETLKGGERFSMRTIADNFAASTNLLDECLPVCHADGVFGDLFSGCTEGVVINDKRHLKQAVVQQLNDLLTNFVELPNSEIVRTLGLSAPSELRPGRTNRFYIFTDLIENSQYLSGKEFFTAKTMCFSGTSPRMGWSPTCRAPLCGSSESVAAAVPGDRHPSEASFAGEASRFLAALFRGGSR